MISETEALERAREWLTQSGTAVAGRQGHSTRKQVYIVVFPPPENTLGGDFTLIIDAETGAVLSAVIER